MLLPCCALLLAAYFASARRDIERPEGRLERRGTLRVIYSMVMGDPVVNNPTPTLPWIGGDLPSNKGVIDLWILHSYQR